MDEEKEIEKEIEQMAAEIQYAMDAVQEKNKTAIPAEVLAWYLVQRKGYRKADEVRKETAKHIKWSIINNLPFDDDAYEIIDEIFAEYGVEVDE